MTADPRKSSSLPEITCKASPDALENDLLRLKLNGYGEITSIYDKETDREIAAGSCNSLKLFQDIPVDWDAWDINTMYALKPVDLPEKAARTVVSFGPVQASVRISRKIHQSTLTQEIILRAGSRRIDFKTRIDWQERHKMLKVAFPVRVHANEAAHDIQFGFIKRSNHISKPFDADRFEVPQQKWTVLMESACGVAVLNDCKYGVNVVENCINLTLLRAPVAPDPVADRGVQEFTYALYPWNGPFAECAVVREAYDLNAPCRAMQGNAGAVSLLSTDAPNIVLEAMKPAEDGSGDIVLRLYEAMQMRTACTMTAVFPISKAALTDMLEENPRPIRITSNTLALEFRPFEIKTVRLSLR